MRRLYWALILCFLLSACGRSETPAPSPEPKPQPVPESPAPAPAPQEAAPVPAPSTALLPKEGLYSFYLIEGHGGEWRGIDEEWVREGNRLYATQGGGRPYVTWLLEPDGLWRADPHNPKVLLRYLPPQLQDGATWRQQSGSEWVWFRLRKQALSENWVLTVLNRGERTDWRFEGSRGYHEVAAEAMARPADAFWKMGGSDMVGPVTAERRQAILAAAMPPPTDRAPLESVNSGAFVGALEAVGYQRKAVDFTGDAINEQLVAAWDRPSWFGPEMLGAEAQVVAEAENRRAQALSLVMLGGRPRLLFLGGGWGGALSIRWFAIRDGKWANVEASDLGPKMIGWTPATRAQVLEDGRLQVEWEPFNDPAGHLQVRHLRLTPEDKVEWLDERWGPRAAALTDPQSPQELLQAFFFTQWFGLQEEAQRYLAQPEMATQFPVKGQPTAFTTEGRVEIGRIEANCQTVKQELPASGPIPFYATVSWYEGGHVQGGTAQVGRAPDGRLVIESIEIADSCFDY